MYEIIIYQLFFAINNFVRVPTGKRIHNVQLHIMLELDNDAVDVKCKITRDLNG